jgi:hypothetical protein
MVSHRTLVQVRISSVVGRLGKDWEFRKGTSNAFHIVNRAGVDGGNYEIWMIAWLRDKGAGKEDQPQKFRRHLSLPNQTRAIFNL